MQQVILSLPNASNILYSTYHRITKFSVLLPQGACVECEIKCVHNFFKLSNSQSQVHTTDQLSVAWQHFAMTKFSTRFLSVVPGIYMFN